MNWYIGQEIVCVKDHSQKMVKRGRIYTIIGLMKSPCKCNNVLIDVGVKVPDQTGSGLYQLECSRCNHEADCGTDSTLWIDEKLFAPLADISELKEILEKQPETEKAWQTKKYRLQNQFL